jgi:N-acyl-D-amino-acid deacylase
MIRAYRFFALAAAVTVSAVLISPCICAAQTSLRADSFDVLIKGGMVYDGTGQTPRRADVGIRGDRIVAIGDLQRASAKSVIDATGLAVTPGFINMLSHSEVSLIADGHSMGELKQGVTTQIFGESSMGPLTDEMKKRRVDQQGDIKYDIAWTTLAEYLAYLEKRGVSQNFASFIGAATVREYVIGLEDKPPTPEQLDKMRELVRQEMEAGALGVTTALIYPPATFARTDELIELSKVAAKYNGKYIADIRSEANQAHRGGRRDYSHQSPSRSSGRNLPLESFRARELAQARSSNRHDRRGASPGTENHC